MFSTMGMKRIIFLGDGMSDWPVESLGGKTPLQAANTPALDRIAREGQCGTLETIKPGMPSGSATANLGVLGYDAYALFGMNEGRGVLEAALATSSPINLSSVWPRPQPTALFCKGSRCP